MSPPARLGRLEGLHHALGKVAFGGFEGLRHGGNHPVVEHHVGLDAVSLAHVMSGGLDALGTGVGRHPALNVDKGDLADSLTFVH